LFREKTERTRKKYAKHLANVSCGAWSVTNPPKVKINNGGKDSKGFF